MNPQQFDPNPPYGERGNFRKLTVTLPPAVYERLIRETARRKIAGESNQLLSTLLREALSEYLDRLDADDLHAGDGVPYHRSAVSPR
jgi:hypothetical protein